jgi:phospholipase C
LPWRIVVNAWPKFPAFFALSASALALGSCGGGSSPSGALPSARPSASPHATPSPSPKPTPTLTPTAVPTAAGGVGVGVGPAKIKHVVFVVQENRSFDDIFGGFDASGKPFPGADVWSNPDSGEPTPHDHNGNPVTMQQGLLEDCFSPAHYHPNSVQDVDGGAMNGFDLEPVSKLACAPSTPPPTFPYRYIAESEVASYWQLAETYVVADRMFEPMSSGSFGAHLYLAAGQSANTIDEPSNTPWGCDAPIGTIVDVITHGGGEVPGVFPCFAIPSFADELDLHGVSWRYYAGARNDYGYLWSIFDAFERIRNGPEWTSNVINPPAQFLTDVGNGTLAAMTWITPTLDTSDHPVSHSNLGPSWVASVVNAVGASQFWNSTAIFITWDDWGGWYDHVPPPTLSPVALGIRVPLIVVSPYARAGYVSHVVHTTGSVLHFAEEAFNLPSLGEEDARADDLGDAFDFTQMPRTFGTQLRTRYKVDAIRRAASTSRGRPAGARDDDD